jgi:hypothetical protein
MNVFRRAVPEDDGSGVVASSSRAGAAPAVAAIGRSDPIFASIRLTGGKAFTPRLDQARQVVRMDQLHPAVPDQLLGRLADPLGPAGPDLNDLAIRIGKPGDLPAQLEGVTIQTVIELRIIPLGQKQIFIR